MSAPSVSVILPVFNRAATLSRCIASVRAQTFSDWEIIVVDDASSDDSIVVLEDFREPRIRIFRHEKNRGPAAARNTALREARGEFIALIDSDDEWLPEKLEKQIALLRSGSCDFCGCEYWLVENARERRVHLSEPESWARLLHTECKLGNGTTLVAHRGVLEKIGGLDESLRLYEDWDWVLRMASQFRYALIHEPLARVHESGRRRADLYAESAERFLAKHDTALAKVGATHRRRVRGKHFENVAACAFENRDFALGCRYLAKSFLANPWQSPLRLGAFFLAPIDAVFGTSLIYHAAKLFGGPRDPSTAK